MNTVTAEAPIVALPPPRFVENGDGTVTDSKQGLQWSKATLTPECTTHKKAKKVARKAPRKPVAREDVVMPEAAPSIVARPDNITPLQAAVRSLIRFAMASDRPLDAVTRGAVIDATREAA